MKRKIFFILSLLLLSSTVFAAEEENQENGIGDYIVEKFYDFTLDLFNAPINQLISITEKFLMASPQIDAFYDLWRIITYTISFFYGLLFIYSGFQFILSGHDVLRREMAKEWLKNTFVMIVLIQASFFLYGLILDLGTTLTTSTLSLVNYDIFNVDSLNAINQTLHFILIPSYTLTLFLTLLFLSIRYLIITMGVLLVPIAIFFYFIPPLKSYGKLIFNILGMFIFISFIASLFILASSMIANMPIYDNIKILVMISCFFIIDLLFLILTWHAIIKSAIPKGGDKIAMAIKYITKTI